jgi:hypothetical protein
MMKNEVWFWKCFGMVVGSDMTLSSINRNQSLLYGVRRRRSSFVTTATVKICRTMENDNPTRHLIHSIRYPVNCPSISGCLL